MRFHLTDRILGHVPDESIRTRKVTSRLETYWRDSAGGPVMPPALVLEALCQAGAWLVMLSTGVRRRAALLSVAEVEVTGPVRPGDVLDVDAWVESMSDEAAVMSGVATVDGRVVLRATDVMCALVDVAQLDDPEVTRLQLDRLVGQGGPR
ncbi:3-hydroxylacyl-ACP dehydratase [Phytohabitans houttuyneae]|uniref:3-hydroxyacyl-[acyl-carrier-protein] dehydratase FabZ n=1 Tax=Phytohabitans houttuyneae TaxID=1076126 RepID=A0A6V8KNM9_9ACTN|nr:3-hydroxylacyl-ACP dehydratase [Phytohabitans houttuyneae]GFJ83377.1 3-hydroxyacyl-[acyl-carrier-protein] dehydratase FabZ [Phytohabitans houttuyneae]